MRVLFFICKGFPHRFARSRARCLRHDFGRSCAFPSLGAAPARGSAQTLAADFRYTSKPSRPSRRRWANQKVFRFLFSKRNKNPRKRIPGHLPVQNRKASGAVFYCGSVKTKVSSAEAAHLPSTQAEAFPTPTGPCCSISSQCSSSTSPGVTCLRNRGIHGGVFIRRIAPQPCDLLVQRNELL